MSVRVGKFSLYSLLLLITLFPIGIGTIGTCYMLGGHLFIVIAEKYGSIREVTTTPPVTSRKPVKRAFVFTEHPGSNIAAEHFAPGHTLFGRVYRRFIVLATIYFWPWIIAMLWVSVSTYVRSKTARILACTLAMSVLPAQLISRSFLQTLSDGPLNAILADCICAFLALFLCSTTFFVISRIQRFPMESKNPPLPTIRGRIATACVIITVLAMSAFGWSYLFGAA